MDTQLLHTRCVAHTHTHTHRHTHRDTDTGVTVEKGSIIELNGPPAQSATTSTVHPLTHYPRFPLGERERTGEEQRYNRSQRHLAATMRTKPGKFHYRRRPFFSLPPLNCGTSRTAIKRKNRRFFFIYFFVSFANGI